MIADPHEIQRLLYTPGQDLLSRDFRDQAGFEEQLRWWHNRAMHGAFGVRYGLQARLASDAGGPTVEVDGGLAYDAFGRELILPAPRSLRVPRGETEPQTLVIRRREECGAPSPSELAAICFCDPAPGGTDLAWVPSRRLRPADGVPLARFVYDGDDPSRDDSFAVPAARPLSRPRLGNGSTIPGGTVWEVWKTTRFGNDVVFGLQVPIHTSAAGFTRIPCYFAWVSWAERRDQAGAGNQGRLPFLSHVAGEKPNRFLARVQFHLVLPDRQITDNLHIDDLFQAAFLAIARQQLSVCWLGVQMRADDYAHSEVTHGHP